jgi:parvulin-like peptidyl-prolyl isomerase
MNKSIIIAFFMLFAWIGIAQNKIAVVTTASPAIVATSMADETNALNSVTIELDGANNRIYFKSPEVIEGVNISIKDRSNKIILRQNNMRIAENYSISFPPPENDNRYTIILQKDNHILVERLPNEQM